MEKSKKNLLFIIVNVLLVAIVGVILGVCLPITQSNALLLSYIMTLVTLACPIAAFLTIKNFGSPVGIASIFFIAANLITMIVFMFTIKEIKVVAITEGAIIGAFLIIMLVCIACAPKKKE